MENNKKEEFIKELKTLLEKYDVNIGFVCDPCSDTNGIYEAGLEVCENRQTSSKNTWLEFRCKQFKN